MGQHWLYRLDSDKILGQLNIKMVHQTQNKPIYISALRNKFCLKKKPVVSTFCYFCSILLPLNERKNLKLFIGKNGVKQICQSIRMIKFGVVGLSFWLTSEYYRKSFWYERKTQYKCKHISHNTRQVNKILLEPVFVMKYVRSHI